MKNFWFVSCITLLFSVNRAFGAEAGMPQLDPEFWIAQIFWLVLIFFSLYLIIWKIFLPKITLSIENRKSRIVNDLDDAQKLKDKAEKKLGEYKEIIEKSKKEAKKIIDDARKKIDEDIEKKKKQFNEEVEKELITVEKEIINLQKTSIKNINIIATESASEVMKQIINIEVNNSSVSAIVNDIAKRKMGKQL